MEDQEFLICKTPQGFAAASTKSPFFCFIADTEAEAVATVTRARAFYRDAHESAALAEHIPTPKPLSITPLRPARRMSTRELAVA